MELCAAFWFVIEHDGSIASSTDEGSDNSPAQCPIRCLRRSEAPTRKISTLALSMVSRSLFCSRRVAVQRHVACRVIASPLALWTLKAGAGTLPRLPDITQNIAQCHRATILNRESGVAVSLGRVRPRLAPRMTATKSALARTTATARARVIETKIGIEID